MSEEGQRKEMPKTGQRKTTGDRPMSKRPNDRSMQGSTGMPRPRFNQSGIRHSLRYGAAPKAQNGIEESQRKNLRREANARRWQRKINAKQLATGQCSKDPTTGQCKEAQGCHDHALINRESGTAYGMAPHPKRKTG